MRAATPATDSIAIRAAKARAAQLLKQTRSRVATAARLQDARDAFAIARAARAAEAAPMAVDLIAAPPRGEEWIESFDDHYQAPRPRGFVTTRRLRENATPSEPTTPPVDPSTSGTVPEILGENFWRDLWIPAQAPFWTNARTGVATWLDPKGGASGAI